MIGEGQIGMGKYLNYFHKISANGIILELAFHLVAFLYLFL